MDGNFQISGQKLVKHDQQKQRRGKIIFKKEVNWEAQKYGRQKIQISIIAVNICRLK